MNKTNNTLEILSNWPFFKHKAYSLTVDNVQHINSIDKNYNELFRYDNYKKPFIVPPSIPTTKNILYGFIINNPSNVPIYLSDLLEINKNDIVIGSLIDNYLLEPNRVSSIILENPQAVSNYKGDNIIGLNLYTPLKKMNSLNNDNTPWDNRLPLDIHMINIIR